MTIMVKRLTGGHYRKKKKKKKKKKKNNIKNEPSNQSLHFESFIPITCSALTLGYLHHLTQLCNEHNFPFL